MLENYLTELFGSNKKEKELTLELKKYISDLRDISAEVDQEFGKAVRHIITEYTDLITKWVDKGEIDRLSSEGLADSDVWEIVLSDKKLRVDLYKEHKREIDKIIIQPHVTALKRALPKIRSLAKKYIDLHEKAEEFFKQKELEPVLKKKWYQLLGGHKANIKYAKEIADNYKKGLRVNDNKIISETLAIPFIIGKSNDLFNHGTDFLDEHTMGHMWEDY